MTAAARARLAKVAWLQEAHRFSELGYMLFGDLWPPMYFCMQLPRRRHDDVPGASH